MNIHRFLCNPHSKWISVQTKYRIPNEEGVGPMHLLMLNFIEAFVWLRFDLALEMSAPSLIKSLAPKPSTEPTRWTLAALIAMSIGS
jgi:hypothetical protein